MVHREVKWTLRAAKDKLLIYQYWFDRNESVEYPKQLDKLFNQSMFLTSLFPYSGRETNSKNVRFRLVRNFRLYYRILPDSIEVLSIWDCNMDPKKNDLQ